MTRLRHGRAATWLGLLLVFALIVAACSGDDEGASEETTSTTAASEETTTTAPLPETTTTAAAPETTTSAQNLKPYGGSVIVADDQEPPTLNPYVPGGDKSIVSIVGQSYLSGAYEIDGHTLLLIPEQLTELPSVENGRVVVNEDLTMTVTYQIRDEAVWADGTPISGDDYQFTLDVIMDPDLPVIKNVYEDIVDTEVGPKSFSYTLRAPTAQYELLFNQIIPRHDVEGSDFQADWNETMWVSSGPFEFVEWQKGDFIRVVRNSNYWKVDAETGQTLPYVDEVTFRFIPDPESVVNAFRARDVDIIQPPPATETIEALQALVPEGAQVEILSGPTWEHFNFQFGPGRLERNENSVNDNLTYRQAVAHAIDKYLIVDEILAGQVEPLDSFVEAFSPSLSNDNWAKYDYNIDKSRALVEAAKAELGLEELSAVFSTTSNNEARVRLSELFVQMFADVGINYENSLEDSQLFFGETLTNGLWDLGEWAWVGSPGFSGLISVMDVFDPEAPPPDGQNYYRWGSPDSSVINEASARFAEIRDELNSTVDGNVLEPLIAEAEAILADELVIIPLYARLVNGAAWGDEVQGWKLNPTDATHTWNMEEWYRVDL